MKHIYKLGIRRLLLLLVIPFSFLSAVPLFAQSNSKTSVYYQRFVRDKDGNSLYDKPPQASFTAYLNSDSTKILIENAPRWDGGNANIQGNG